MGYVSDGTIVTLRSCGNIGIFFRSQTSPDPVHLAFSLNDIPIVMPNLDAPGTVYIAAGQLLDVPELEVLINGVADSATFQLNGVSTDWANRVTEAYPEVLGALTTIGFAPMDERWQPLTDIIPVWTGVADYLAEEMKVETDPAKNRVQSIMMVCSAGDTSRAFSHLRTYTDQSQQAQHPGDRFFERVTRYVQGVQISWPRF